MRKLSLLAALLCLTSSLAMATTISVVTAAAPNSSGDAVGYAAWVDNAITAFLSAATSSGDATLPGYYQGVASFTPTDLIATSDFNSWNGSASPSGDFANEFGNRATLIGVISNSPGMVDIANGAGFVVPPFGGPDVPNPGGSVTYTTYNSTTAIGVNDLGGGTFGKVTSGTGSVNYIFLLPGFAYETSHQDSTDFFGGDDQANLDDLANTIAAEVAGIDYCFSYGGANSASTCGGVDVAAAPEPGSLSLLSCGILGLSFAAWRHRRNASR